MEKINLINPAESSVPYVLTVFPDGEPHIKFAGDINRKTDYKVICRIANPTDLFVLMQIGDILNRSAVEFEIDIMYLMSMRMDRVISFNESFTLNVVANVINGLNARKVRIFHSHSSRVFSLIKNSVDMEEDYGTSVEPTFPCEHYAICYPDAGARDRYCDKELKPGQVWQLIQLEKMRDLSNNGAIVGMRVVSTPINFAPEAIIIEDDLCDAGGTFVAAANLLRTEYPNAKIGIFVRHLVNEVGLERLSKTFDFVVVTDSYRDWNKDVREKNLTNVNVIHLQFCHSN